MANKVAELYQQGKHHYDKGEKEQAMECFLELFGKSEGFADARNIAGLLYHGRGDFEKAVECFERALKINPNYTEASLNLAVTYNEMGRYKKAKEVYQSAQRAAGKADSLDPFVKGKLANMHAEIGDVYAGIGFLESAIDEFKKALNMRPDFVDVRTKLGIAYRDRGDLNLAIRELKEAASINPAYAPASVNLGIAYYSDGDIEKAREEWASVIKKHPDNRLARMYLNLTESQAEG